ncbi:YwbE family protein, partial [Bacillus paranthracis]|uniref:YwbE family protein n=1 Tax=Bacillus paranthracis TaxID=2026186 RepID=UPI0021CDF5C2
NIHANDFFFYHKITKRTCLVAGFFRYSNSCKKLAFISKIVSSIVKDILTNILTNTETHTYGIKV